MIAPGSLSRRESRKDLWAWLICVYIYIYILVTTCYVILLSSVTARRCKMLVFDRLDLPLYSGISAV
jgi:hypothetical protein